MESNTKSTKALLKGFDIAYYPDHAVVIPVKECYHLIEQLVKVIVSRYIDYKKESDSFDEHSTRNFLKDFENYNIFITDVNSIIQYVFSLRRELNNSDLDVVNKRNPVKTKLVYLIGLSDISIEYYKSNGKEFKKVNKSLDSLVEGVYNAVSKGLKDIYTVYDLC